LTFPIEPLQPHHDRPDFHCGNEALDRYFHERIRRDVEASVAAAFVMADGPKVLGYYTLSAHHLERSSLPEEIVKKLKLPKYPFIPATLMGPLAVNRDQQGKGGRQDTAAGWPGAQLDKFETGRIVRSRGRREGRRCAILSELRISTLASGPTNVHSDGDNQEYVRQFVACGPGISLNTD